VTLELIAAFVAAVAGAGVALMLRHLSRGRLPRWLIPAGAAAGLMGMTIYNEYGWFPRLRAGLPEGVVVAQTLDGRALWRPWAYVWPMTEGALLVDTRRTMRHPADPALVVTQVWRFARWQPAREGMVAFDCDDARRVDITEGVRFTETGGLEGGRWVELAADDPVLRVACDGG
jgi:hypothetical protein